jgi:nucleotide-binding universal stress UspA family protein
MKSLLVPVDFSPASENAARFAAQLARLEGTRLILLHAYRLPVSTSEMPVLVSLSEVEEAAYDQMERLQTRLMNDFPNVEVDGVCRMGFAVDSIIEASVNFQPQMIVMGMRGHSGAVERVLGSNTTALMKRAFCPVLIVPEFAKFVLPEILVVGCDHPGAISPRVRDLVKSLSAAFHSKVEYVSVMRKKPELALHDEVNANQDYKAVTLQGEDVVDEINKYMDQTPNGWLVMMPHRYGVLESIFHVSKTRKMAWHTHVPLLSI